MADKWHPILSASAPALGDIRQMGEGDVIAIHRSALSRRDWPRYWEAIGVAFSRGAKLIRL